MKEVKLKKGDTDTVFVDDVRVEDGVYLKAVEPCGRTNIRYVMGLLNKYKVALPNNNTLAHPNYDSLLNILIEFKTQDEDCLWNAYTLSGKRIVTERELCVDDLEDTDHVGFVADNHKAYIVRVNDGEFKGLTTELHGNINMFWDAKENLHLALDDAIKYSTITEVYTFQTIKLLHKWLSE